MGARDLQKLDNVALMKPKKSNTALLLNQIDEQIDILKSDDRFMSFLDTFWMRKLHKIRMNILEGKNPELLKGDIDEMYLILRPRSRLRIRQQLTNIKIWIFHLFVASIVVSIGILLYINAPFIGRELGIEKGKIAYPLWGFMGVIVFSLVQVIKNKDLASSLKIAARFILAMIMPLSLIKIFSIGPGDIDYNLILSFLCGYSFKLVIDVIDGTVRKVEKMLNPNK